MRPDDHDLDEEIRGHLALSVRERIERGEDPEAARLASLREFGYVPAVRDSMRRVWYSRWFEAVTALGLDMRVGLRSLLHAKGLAATVVVTPRKLILNYSECALPSRRRRIGGAPPSQPCMAPFEVGHADVHRSRNRSSGSRDVERLRREPYVAIGLRLRVQFLARAEHLHRYTHRHTFSGIRRQHDGG